ncbi:MAG: hypothetical protein OXJ55_06310 [Caldilineaceae bacterium]|nr:hypothetical protein [Caldilineaceae bacterium]
MEPARGRVAAWRRSGLSKIAYTEQHDLACWSIRYWADKLAGLDDGKSQKLKELESAGAGAEHGGDRVPIVLAVGDH